ncbi:hypothetical protein LUZ61_020729 [Rhynchospora tenuis]|uniref:Tubulin-specific chaperone A n=1 Tax=Rhynchospora tenuis TaxID=198213 RepID=A0AAD5ZDZ6_9POAL|nr:hypothetical protein LUZ61_020729 [Rhynchospora tenuis]
MIQRIKELKVPFCTFYGRTRNYMYLTRCAGILFPAPLSLPTQRHVPSLPPPGKLAPPLLSRRLTPTAPLISSARNMATIRNLKIKTSTCKRIVKELHSYEKEVETEAAKTAEMKERGADPYDLKQQENVLAESRMMVPDCRKRLEAALIDLKATLAEIKESNQEGTEVEEAEAVITQVETVVQTAES